MAGKRINSKDASKLLNEFVKTIDHLPFNDLVKLFKDKKVPYSQQVITHFIRQNYLIKCDGKYTWAKETPIYHEELSAVFQEQREAKYNSYKTRITEEEAIAFLKEKGYKIYKPIIEHIEV